MYTYIVRKNSSRRFFVVILHKRILLRPSLLPLRSGRILPSTDVTIVNRFKLEINMLEPPRNRHSVKVVSGMVLKGEERGRELWADL